MRWRQLRTRTVDDTITFSVSKPPTKKGGCFLNQPVDAMLQAIVNELVAVGGVLNGAKVLPYSNQISPTQKTTYQQLGVVIVPGVNPVTPSWFGASTQADGSWSILGSQCRFSITDPTQPAVINGFCLFTGPGGSGTGGNDVLLYVDPLPQPIQLTDTTQIAAYVPQFEIGATGTQFGQGSTVFN